MVEWCVLCVICSNVRFEGSERGDRCSGVWKWIIVKLKTECTKKGTLWIDRVYVAV